MPNKTTPSPIQVLEASAGSGKTYALAKRYIQLLMNSSVQLDAIPIKNILGITFTKKATFEMKQRIVELLKKIALDDFRSEGEAGDVYSSLGIPKEAAREKAYRIINDYIIKNYDFFQVQTIDSFVRSIISGSAFKLNLSSSFKIETDYESRLQYSLDNLVDRAAGPAGRGGLRELFTKFMKQYLFVEENPGWFPKESIYETVKYLYSLNNRYGAAFARTKTESADIIPVKKNVIKLANALYGEVKNAAGLDKRFRGSLEKFVNENTESFDWNISAYFKREAVPFNKGHACGKKAAQIWDELRPCFSQIAEMEAYSLHNYYIDIFNTALKDFREISSADDVIFLEELNNRARFLFDEESADYITVPEMYFRLSLRFRHLLIDEFQDTSRLQWRNLKGMADEILSNGGSLFYVGDKKQAIYRFRGGDVSLFSEAAEELGRYGVNKGTLSKNYRSQKAIVEFNNLVFSRENIEGFIQALKENEKDDISGLKSGDITDILEIFSDSRQEHKKGNEHGYVKVELVQPLKNGSGAQDEDMPEKLVNLVKDLKKSFDYRDIAILVRKNDEIETYTSLLLESKIPVESEKTLNIRENYLVKELVSLLMFLDSPSNNLFFASFLLGDIFLKKSGLKAAEIRDFLFELRVSRKKGEIIYLYKEFQGRYPEIWDALFSEFFKNAGLVPLYEFVISIYAKFSVMDNFREYQGFLMKFLELIKAQDSQNGAGSADISQFLEYLEELTDEKELYVNAEKGDSVRILTIHKAKGLEFPVVIIPALSLLTKVGNQVIDEGKKTLNLLHITKSHVEYSEKIAAIYYQQYKKAFIDELNSIYVALTRAKYELYVFIPEKVSGKKNKAKYLFSFEEAGFEKGARGQIKYGGAEKTAREEKPVEIMPVSRYSGWIEPMKEEFAGVTSLKNRIAIQRGEVLHGALSHIDDMNGRDFKKIADDFPEIEQKARELLGNEKFKDYFNVKEGAVFVEKELVDSSGRTKRVDRLVVLEKQACIIDYKSSESEETAETYKKQMTEYIKLIKEIYPGKAVKGMIIYLDTLNSREV